MSKEAVNILLKNDIGFSNDEDIEDYRTTYLSIVDKTSEEDFYNSMIGWFFDGNAPYYDNWLERNWR